MITHQDILQDAEWLPHRYDETNGSFRFRHVPRDVQREAAFLTDEHLPDTGAERVIPLERIDRRALPAAPIHFVFHSAYCCSTLVARMFDAPGYSMGLVEPVVLNDVVGWRRRGAQPEKIAAVLDMALALLARPFGDDRAVVVKPSNIVNSLAPAIMGLRADAHAILLYAPIEDFLASIAVKGLWGRRWVRQAMIGQMQDGVLAQQFAPDEMFELTDLQVAGLGWLSHHSIYRKMQDRFGAGRLGICDSRSLLAEPAETVAKFFARFELHPDPEDSAAIAAGPAFTRNSKESTSYSRSDRERQIAATREANSDEIAKVAEWVRVVADGIGLDVAPVSSALR